MGDKTLWKRGRYLLSWVWLFFILDVGTLPIFTDVACPPQYNLCVKVDYADGSSELLLLIEDPEEPTVLTGHAESDIDAMAVVILADEVDPDDTVRFTILHRKRKF